MPRFASYDSTKLTYHVRGIGPPLVCLPGGPARASSYLDNLGGLDTERTLILLDHRGTGESAVPDDPTSYRCERIVDDVTALRAHLGLDRMELLAHSAAGNIAQLYAARHPDRLSRLVLVTPASHAVGIEPTGVEQALAVRSGEWWYPPAKAALDAWAAAAARGASFAELTPLRAAAEPFGYGRWDEQARTHSEADAWQRSEPGTVGFYADFAPDIEAVRDGLQALDVPVLIVAGELDRGPTPGMAERLAALFPRAEVAVQAGAAHFPWIDDPLSFARAVLSFLRRPPPDVTPGGRCR